MQCVNPVRIYPDKQTRIKPRYPDGLLVPCGKCIACRIKRRQEWSTRMLHEMEAHDDSVFLTLTYSDNFLPDRASLRKRDCQLFYKRLRKSLGNRRIRYFGCGEYGDTSGRPHYHHIIFGLSLRPNDRQMVMDAWPYTDWTIPVISQKSFGLVEPDSIRYVAQYVDKKFTGDLAQSEYIDKGREPVFHICSQGLGRDYVDRHADQIKNNLSLTVNGVKQSLPRYYVNRLNLDVSSLKDDAYIQECDIVSHYSGYDYSRDEAYKVLKPDEVLKIEEGIKNAKAQHELNLYAKIASKQSKKL